MPPPTPVQDLAETRRGPQWFGQPLRLTVLFLTEMWENFSFFGTRAILVYYRTKALHFPVAKASLAMAATSRWSI